MGNVEDNAQTKTTPELAALYLHACAMEQEHRSEVVIILSTNSHCPRRVYI